MNLKKSADIKPLIQSLTDRISYDKADRLVAVIDWLGKTTSYSYDAAGNLVMTYYPEGSTIGYGYDTSSRLTNIKPSASTFTYGYTDVNPLFQSLTRPNGSVTEYQYNDPLKRLTSIINKKSTQEIINSFAYTYNNLDVRDTETITNGEVIDNFVAGITTYANNNLNQTTNTTNPNRTYTYDDDGNMTTGYTPGGYQITMTYDAENRMKTAEYTDSSSVVHRTEYLYSGDSFLAKQKKYNNGVLVTETNFVRAGFLPVQERDSNNLIAREYTWGINYGGGIGGLLNLRQGGADDAYLYDDKGNVSALLDGDQAVIAAYIYDPFGGLTRKTGSLNQNYMFSTKGHDPETGLSYYGYRFYSPSIGKWTTRDPIEEVGGLNLYGFVINCPNNLTDPSGLDPKGFPILRCHVNPHWDGLDNAAGAGLLVGAATVPVIVGSATGVVTTLIYRYGDKIAPVIDYFKDSDGRPSPEDLPFILSDQAKENRCSEADKNRPRCHY